MPWRRLLLWVFACAALLFSLVIRADNLADRERRSVMRGVSTERSSTSGRLVFGASIDGGGADAYFLTLGPPPLSRRQSHAPEEHSTDGAR